MVTKNIPFLGERKQFLYNVLYGRLKDIKMETSEFEDINGHTVVSISEMSHTEDLLFALFSITSELSSSKKLIIKYVFYHLPYLPHFHLSPVVKNSHDHLAHHLQWILLKLEGIITLTIPTHLQLDHS